MKAAKKGFLLKILVVAVIVYAAVQIVSLTSEIARKRAEIKRLEALVEDQTAENVSLRRAINREFTEEEIKKIARERLNLASVDEDIYVNITGD